MTRLGFGYDNSVLLLQHSKRCVRAGEACQFFPFFMPFCLLPPGCGPLSTHCDISPGRLTVPDQCPSTHLMYVSRCNGCSEMFKVYSASWPNMKWNRWTTEWKMQIWIQKKKSEFFLLFKTRNFLNFCCPSLPSPRWMENLSAKGTKRWLSLQTLIRLGGGSLQPPRDVL